MRQPDYFKAIGTVLDETPLANWKSWLKWQILTDAAPYLSKPFVDEDFAFFEKTLSGSPGDPAAVEAGRGARRASSGRGRSASSMSPSISRPPPRSGCRSWSQT